jgi:hypothetical protein
MAEMNVMILFQVPVQKRSIPPGLPISALLRWFGEHRGKLFPEFWGQLTHTSGAMLFVQSTEAMFVHPAHHKINAFTAQMMPPAQLQRGCSIHKALKHRDPQPFSDDSTSRNQYVKGFPGNFFMRYSETGFLHMLLPSEKWMKEAYNNSAVMSSYLWVFI